MTLIIKNGPATGVTIEVPDNATIEEQEIAVLEAIVDVVTREPQVGANFMQMIA